MEQNKYVVDSNHKKKEIPADQDDEQASHSSVTVIAARSKAKTKPQKREPVDAPSIIPMNERKWIHNQTVQREEDGAIQNWRMKFHLRNQFSQVQHWSAERWKVCLAAGGGSRRRYQYCSDNLGRILHLRALQGHSGNNLIDPTLQDNLMIESGIFHHIYHIGCTFNLHSIINNGLVLGGQNFEQSSCPLIQETKVTKILNILTSRYHVEHDTCTVHGRGTKLALQIEQGNL